MSELEQLFRRAGLDKVADSIEDTKYSPPYPHNLSKWELLYRAEAEGYALALRHLYDIKQRTEREAKLLGSWWQLPCAEERCALLSRRVTLLQGGYFHIDEFGSQRWFDGPDDFDDAYLVELVLLWDAERKEVVKPQEPNWKLRVVAILATLYLITLFINLVT